MLAQILEQQREKYETDVVEMSNDPLNAVNYDADLDVIMFLMESSGGTITLEQAISLASEEDQDMEFSGESIVAESMDLKNFSQVVNSRIHPEYNMDLSPVANVIDMGLVRLEQDYILTPEGRVPTELPDALLLAVQSKSEGSDTPISSQFLGIPSLDTLVPRFPPSPHLTQEELDAVREALSYMEGDCPPELYFMEDPPVVVEALLKNTGIAGLEVAAAVVETEDGEVPGSLAGVNLPYPIRETKGFGGWLLDHNLNFFPFFTPIKDLESKVQNLVEEVVEFRPPSPVHSPRQESWVEDSDDIFGHYKGPRWRKQVVENGKKKRMSFPSNILLAGKLREVKRTYPHIDEMVSMISNQKWKRAVEVVGRVFRNYKTQKVPFKKAIYIMANAFAQSGHELQIAEPYGNLNPFETASMVLVQRPNTKYWTVNRETETLIIKGYD
jgi:hypothetical protein